MLFPEYSALSDISASGIGSGTIQLTLSANDIGALNTLLTSLEFAGPSLASGQHLTYDLWNHDGVLPREVTSGNIYLNTVGTAASTATYALNTQTLITSTDTLSGTLDVCGTVFALGNLVGNGAVSVAPGAVLELPYNSALLGGTSYDFGTVAAQDIVESGQLVIGGAASLQGELVLNTNALVDFADGLTVDTGAANDFQEGLTLASGAVLEGVGTLSAGDFSASGMIDGTGAILALHGETLEIDAGMVSVGVNLDVAGGGVMVRGPVAPLTGIFNTHAAPFSRWAESCPASRAAPVFSPPPHGYRPVEALPPGDSVINTAGERRPVRWIGWRTMDLGPRSARAARPVIVLPGAFSPGKLFKTLRLSPLHCVYVQGVPIPVIHLVNGATILHDEAAPAMTYYHLELDRHDVLLAEGLECESYYCNANRGQLYQELRKRTPARHPFAANITSGARLAAVRRQLHDRALAAGFMPGYVPRLRAVGEGMDALPRFSRAGGWRYASFNFPVPVQAFTLLCQVAAPRRH